MSSNNQNQTRANIVMNQLDLVAKYNDVCRELAETKQELEKVKEDKEELESDLANELKLGIFAHTWREHDYAELSGVFEENMREILDYYEEEDLQSRFGYLFKIAKEYGF